MKIKYLVWRKVICSDVKRLVYGIQGGLSNKGDQAIQNFNSRHENPGLWSGFTNGQVIPRKKEVERRNREQGTNEPTTFDIDLLNSTNPLRLWEDKNDSRKNPVKINQQIWDRTSNHAETIIEVWYLGYMRILNELLNRLIERDGESAEVIVLRDFVASRLNHPSLSRENLLMWIYETQDAFNEINLDTTFLSDPILRDIKSFVENYFYIVAKCEDDNGEDFNVALMAKATSEKLHPMIRTFLLSEEKGGERVDIDMSRPPYNVDAQRVLEALNHKRNIIIYGPPGTGKTHLLSEIAKSFKTDTIFDDFDTEAPFASSGELRQSLVEWCTFHPNYCFENFVLGLEPVIIDKKLGFKPHVGPFLRLAHAASKGVKALLIVDEINRANTADVFGSTLALLENNSVNEASVKLYQNIKLEDGEIVNSISTPRGLFIIGTMNSLDKSVSPLSHELKRRFTIIELTPNVEVLRSYLNKNTHISSEVCEFCCHLMDYLNKSIRNHCGKEYSIGQGYFWSMTEATDNYVDVLGDIISNKLLPHIKDIFPQEAYLELFGVENLNVIYKDTDYGFEMVSLDELPLSKVINAMAVACGSEYRCNITEDNTCNFTSFEEYESAKILKIYDKLKRYKNVILAGCSGVGKSTIADRIALDHGFIAYDKMHWHSSTTYDDVIEGISAEVKGDTIEYGLKVGAVKALADADLNGKRLMIIENIDRSNSAENFGELITLLEPDKRKGAYVRGYNGYISLPEDMFFLCTMNPSSYSQNHLDSALKRRFSIIDMQPDYLLLQLWLEADKYSEADVNINELFLLSEKKLKSLAIQMLKCINEKITISLGSDAQIGHAVLWGLRSHCTVSTLVTCFDETIIPMLEGFCDDEEIAKRILGKDSPLIRRFSHGVEIIHMKNLQEGELLLSIKEILRNA